LWYRVPWLIAAAAVGFVVIAWVMQPADRTKLNVVPRHEAPTLYEWVDGLSMRLDAPRVDAIAIDERLNAGALELNRGVSLRRTRRVLILGRPLLALFDVPTLSAVVAHELGHFSRHHGRLGHWLYRTRRAWEWRLAQADDKDAPAWDRAANGFAKWFVPWFSARSFAHARRCEYEADASAASVADAALLARALIQLTCAARREAGADPRAWRRRQAREPLPPADALSDLLADVRASAATAGLGPTTVEQDLSDTHPPLTSRLNALNVDVAALALGWSSDGDASGPALLGTAWAQLGASDEAWRAEMQRLDWALRHAVLHAQLHRLDELRSRSDASDERIRLEYSMGEARRVVELATRRRAEGTDTSLSRFFEASVHIEGGDISAVPRMLKCIEDDPSFAAPVRTTILEHAVMLALPSDDKERHQQLLGRALKRRSLAARAVLELMQRGGATKPEMVLPWRAALQAALNAHPAIAAGWCVQGTVTVEQTRVFPCLAFVILIEPVRMQALRLDEDEVSRSVHDVVTELLDPRVVVAVQTAFTTESQAARLEKALDAVPGARI
jgi:Zn-dependent protease with chaperone function